MDESGIRDENFEATSNLFDTTAEASTRYDFNLEDSEDSRAYSEGSYTFQTDDPMDETSYDGYDDAYFDLTDTVDDEDKYAVQLVNLDSTENMEDPANSVEIVEETLEENNNDPNNNMDSIDMSAIDISSSPSKIRNFHEAETRPNPERIRDSRLDSSSSDEPLVEARVRFARALSPRPGCSKDSILLPDEAPNEEVLEKTRHILGLVSRIHRDSVFEAISKACKKRVSELKLFDLIPENERLEYPEDISLVGVKNVAKVGTKSGAGPSGALTTKRGPDEDICTIGCKRSSSTPDISISPPMVAPGTIPKVPSSSQISNPGKPIENRVPIPRVQDKHLRASPERNFEGVQSMTVPTTVNRGAIPKIYTDPGVKYGNQGKGKPILPLTISSLSRGSNVNWAKPAEKKLSGFAPVHNSTIVSANNGKETQANPTIQPICTQTNPTIQPIRTQTNSTIQATRMQTNPTIRPQANPTIQPTRPQANPTIQPTRAQVNPTIQPIYVLANSATGRIRPTTNPTTQQIRPTTYPATQQIRPTTNPATQQIQPPVFSGTQKNHLVQKKNPGVEQQPMVVAHSRPQSASTSHNFDILEQIHLERIDQTQPLIAQTLQPQQAQAAAQPVQQKNDQRVICMEMYYKLRNIFPNVDRDYIKKLCPPDWGPGDRDAQLAPLVEHILERGEAVPKIFENENQGAEELNAPLRTVDDIYENLLGIFPDADPHYLREFSEKYVAKPDALKDFVETKLERRDYPTREEYMARLKITEQQRQYTHGFDVKQYLSIIPDPSKHFMDDKRKCRHSTVAFEFLKSHFNRMRVTTISKGYSQNNFNMSLTAEYLKRYGPEMKSKRGGIEMLTEDILLLQEIAYIKHKKEINDYIANVKKTEDDEFKTLKANKQLLECQCCFDDECVPSKCSNCDNGHIFCNNCIVTGTSTKMGEGETRINCFANCGSEFSLSVLQQVLAPTTFSILLKKRQAAEVIEAGLEGLVSCPFCHFASIPPEGDKIFKCLNPECTKESCRLCKELSHVPLKCDEVMKADKARRYVEEKMTEALARKCYKCQKAFFKEEGCNKITCVCGAMQCYLCDQPIKNYSHFRGQGSDDNNCCPLYSDTIRLDAVAVRKVAEQAQFEVMKINPNMRVDTTNLLPAIPRARDGPHQNILNADELPRRAQRALDLPPI